MKYEDIVNAIRNRTGMKEGAIRKTIERLVKKSGLPITSRQAALLYAYQKGVKIEKFAKT